MIGASNSLTWLYNITMRSSNWTTITKHALCLVNTVPGLDRVLVYRCHLAGLSNLLVSLSSLCHKYLTLS